MEIKVTKESSQLWLRMDICLVNMTLLNSSRDFFLIFFSDKEIDVHLSVVSLIATYVKSLNPVRNFICFFGNFDTMNGSRHPLCSPSKNINWVQISSYQ
jgi:hypothetical protein